MSVNRPDRIDRPVAVIGGGTSEEHQVSLSSAAAVAHALRSLDVSVVELTITEDGRWEDVFGKEIGAAEAVHALTGCMAAFAPLHGVGGEDGTIAGFLSLIGVPFVGAPIAAGAVCMDKHLTKLAAESCNVKSAPTHLLRRKDIIENPPFPMPVVVKPVTGGSSNGVCLVTDTSDYRAAVLHARQSADDVIVEPFINGREVDIAVFRRSDGHLQIGAPLEIDVNGLALFDADQKYDGSATFIIPARLTVTQANAIAIAATTLYEALNCSGVVRFDFFVTPQSVLLNEINTSPGLTEQSQVPRMFEFRGLGYPELLLRLLEATLSAARRDRHIDA